MTTPPVTTYAGFSKVSGKISLDHLFEQIGSTTYKHLIDKIGLLVRDGKITEANNVKRQLPFYTVTASYSEKRLPESIEGYSDLITIDIDGLTHQQVATLRSIIEQDEATVGCYISPKQQGCKLFGYMPGEKADKLRKKYFKGPSITYAELEEYHSKIYELTRRHYEELLGVKVDTSGKDISRGVFASYDPNAFLSAERLAKVKPVEVQIIPGEKTVKRTGRKTTDRTKLHVNDEQIAGIDAITRFEFNKCVAATRRIIAYAEGSHNPFLFEMANKCYKRGLCEEDVKKLAYHYFSESGKWDTDTPITNGYTYTSKTLKVENEKKNKRPTIERVKEFLDQTISVRHNTVLDRLDIRFLSGENASSTYRIMETRDLNTLFCMMSEAGINYSIKSLNAIIDSDYAKAYDPIQSYFNALPAWDGTTDYIGELADTIQTTDQTFWLQAFRRWITGMVACATQTKHTNQLVLILSGKQGKGKSTWIRKLLPPEMEEYYSNGMIDPKKTDHMLLLTTRLLINMEEFEGVSTKEIAILKQVISQESITQRNVYKMQAKKFNRRASFIASTNSSRVLSDMSGARRFLMIETLKINNHLTVNYTGVYSQALALINNGFKYWFEGKEIDAINSRNERHRMKDPLEENLYVYFQPGNPQEIGAKWKPAAAILAYLCASGRTQANMQSQQLLVDLLERGEFITRVNTYGITEYCVIPLTMEQIVRTESTSN